MYASCRQRSVLDKYARENMILCVFSPMIKIAAKKKDEGVCLFFCEDQHRRCARTDQRKLPKLYCSVTR